MTGYTLADIETLRAQSGISYEEAIALLDYHNGDVEKALEDIRKNRPGQTAREKSGGKRKGQPAGLLQKLYAARITVSKGDEVVLNVSSLCAGIALLVSPHVVAGGAVVSLALGYRFGFKAQDEAFIKEDIGDIVRNTADKMKQTVDGVAQQFRKTVSGQAEARADKEPLRDTPVDARQEHRAPVIQVPVKVESQDGSVSVTRDGDGFTSATIE